MPIDTFRVYSDEESMLKVYSRRLTSADQLFAKTKAEREAFVARYANEVEEDQVTEEGHRVNVTNGIGIIDTMFASMTAVDVEFIAKAVGNGTPEQAVAATSALNQSWHDTKGARRAKKAVKDALLVDLGVVKVYYDYVTDVEVRDRPDAAVKAELTEVVKNGDQRTIDDILASGEIALVEDVEVVLRDRVCVDYVPWNMVRYDPSANQAEDVRWVAQYTRHPTPEVTLNPTFRAFVQDRYGKVVGDRLLNGLEGDSTIDAVGIAGDYSDVEGLSKDEKEDSVRVTLVEMWDFETGLVTVFPRNRTDLVLHQRVNPLMLNLDLEDRSPFKFLGVRWLPGRFEGVGDMRVIRPSLDELDEYRSNLATHIARTIPKLIGPARALSPAGKKALESTTWGEYVPLEEEHVASEVQPLVPPPLPQETFEVPEKIQAEMKEATGANEVLRGVFPSRRTTATETQLVTSAGQNRQAERRAALEEWYTDVARTMLQLMQVYYDRDRILRYTNDLGEEFVWEWNREDIAMDADIRISLTPRENLTREETFQRWLQVMNLAVAMPETDRNELMRQVYRAIGLREDEIRGLIKTPEEVEAERQREMVSTQLAAAPQPASSSPPGLSISPARS